MACVGLAVLVALSCGPVSATVDYQHFYAVTDASAPQPCGVEVPCAFNIALVGTQYAIVGLEVYDVVTYRSASWVVLRKSDGSGTGELYWNGQTFRWVIDEVGNHAYGKAWEITP